jgi:predicted O-methyltransferase YrrM
MRSIEDKLYEDEVFDGYVPVRHPHFMKCQILNKISEKERESFWGLRGHTGSMLSPETLCLINYFSSISSGTILEIGAFTGGATVSAGLGMKYDSWPNEARLEPNNSRMISIESGMIEDWSKITNEFNLQSKEELFTVLESNVHHYDLTQKIDLFKTDSDDRETLEKIIPILKKDPISVLIIDADGDLEKHLGIYLKYVKKGGYLIFDDYVMRMKFRTILDDNGRAIDKAKPTQEKVHQLVNDGIARSLGVYPWSTWFGQKL